MQVLAPGEVLPRGPVLTVASAALQVVLLRLLSLILTSLLSWRLLKTALTTLPAVLMTINWTASQRRSVGLTQRMIHHHPWCRHQTA
jgi:hypothetical protein